MEWTKEKLIETLKYIIQSSKSKEIAFEETDKLFYNVLSRDDLVNILIDFIAEDNDKRLDEVYSFGSEKPDLKIVH
mgnify:FL=1|tara:strand:+ start:1275 stop:1502 length:228 start_codon:yes stop_codon:yes gene_type:complete